MSRLIVKNLPKSINEDKIRDIFGQKGTVTDVQLKYTPSGKFRQFGFVGYQNENDAQEAADFFNNTRINTSKITVEVCAILGDAEKPKSWSKYSKDSSAYKNLHPVLETTAKKETSDQKVKKDKTTEILEKYKNDPQFEEFLNLHSSKEALKLLKEKQQESTNKSDTESEENEDATEENDNSKPALQQISDLEYMKSLVKTKRDKKEKEPKPKIELFTVKVKGLPYTCKKKHIKQFFKPLTPYTIRIPPKLKGFAYVGFKKEKQMQKALLKDKSFLNGKQLNVIQYKNQANDSQKEEVKPKWKSQEESLQNEESIAESGRIFVRNLSYTTKEDDLQQLFSKYGLLTEVNLPIDATTHKSKGFAVITFLMPEHAVKAYTNLDGSILQGRMLHLLPGKSKDAPTQPEETTNYKQKKAAQQKSQAGSSHNWNALFLGHNAVADVIADTYGTSKQAVLAPNDNGSIAVRLALGETQIVATTKKYLEKEGVCLDAFNAQSTLRSKTVILVKNLPAQTHIRELREMFEKFGTIGRIILPPQGITALVEFLEPYEAKKAFTKLAYTKFKHLPLYLEWAPENSLMKSAKPEKKENVKEESENLEEEIEKPTEEEEEEPEPDSILFVKNLNFQTTDEGLRKHFEPCGKIYYANVATKKDPNNPKERLSMGYGFVQFVHKSSAEKALKDLQQTTLDGKSLELKRSERTLRNQVQTARKTSKKSKQTGTKILVRNVPFQANQKEIFELFKTFGEMKAVRLPRKMTTGDSSHRGFAFVDFFTNGDAKKAFEALSQSTHLYGRRLVLEWAATDEGVDELRKRTAQHFHPEEQVQSKKSVLNIEKD